MELKFVSEKTINGLSIRTDNATEMDPNKGKIGALWQAFDESVPVDYKSGERVYGVYSNYESDHTGKFTVLAGFDGTSFPSNINMEKITIPEAKYLVFTHKGEMPQIAIDAWTEVWNYFSNVKEEHIRLYTTDFEYYPNGNEIEVHVAVK
ncbi:MULTISPECIES: GyrI-like domain-containing protein [unclassified Colwellia]|uniref:GyrI-like domain-containing protein n=1 Tax=unclassified Colwellia TaxID=196834 RepID=UPI0015F7629C|nr:MULTISPECIES: effector binding domain-containing protein [unclassified Colwellia]MBA6354201.1 effector binding domain-containing protein [Colwellia sp. BRX9-1]MBA6355658.1 effector binding domain-containing protein [Colwellia sp. BRX8-3]MBA6361473.1 effector binding domain-containing protein [Colwellia sp. BRX8-6]MBA6367191.1 effector binding domain-containing protein [Colwellia sp. BRX8-5]MBA6376971.1 effector binding domain-containing protein [Colwellia sp. BRX8-2]